MRPSDLQRSEDGETVLRFLSDERWLYDRQAFERRLVSFDAEMDISIDLLREWINDFAPELLPLDHTLATLDRTESFWHRAMTGVDELPVDLCATRIARVIGEIVRVHLDGKWVLCDDAEEQSFGLPCVGAMKGFPADFLLSPLEVVWGVASDVPRGHFFRSVNHLIRVSIASQDAGSS